MNHSMRNSQLHNTSISILRLPVRVVEILKNIFHCRTYHIEGAFVMGSLCAVLVLTHKGPIEYLGAAAVFFTFMHATIAEYMREAESERLQKNEVGSVAPVECCYKLPYYFYAKEIIWLAYFTLLGAYSALVGVVVFLLYQPWRSLWRSYNPR